MKRFLSIILSLSMILALAACGGSGGSSDSGSSGAQDSSSAGTADTSSGDAENPYAGQTLYVANWQAYNSDEDYCEVAFEEKFGCNVEHVYFGSYDELLTMLLTGDAATIDAIVLTQNYTQHFRNNGLLMTVDTADVPSYEEVDTAYKDLRPFAVDDEGVFAFPFTSGITAMAYNPDKVDFEVDSWLDLLDPAVEGHVCLNKNYDAVVRIAAVISGQDPSYPETLDLDLVAESLSQLEPQMLSFWGTQDEQLIAYQSGDYWLGNMWSGAYTQLVQEGYNIEVVHPKEGSMAYMDYWCVVEGTDQYDLACEWVNWIMSYEHQYTMATGRGSEYTTPGETSVYAPINKRALEELTDEEKTLLYLNPAPEKLVMVAYLEPEQQDAWSELYDTFRANMG